MKNIKLILVMSVIFLISCTYQNEGNKEVSTDNVAQKTRKAAKINVQLGLGYFQQGDVQRAKKKLFAAKALAPDSLDVAGGLGYYFEHTGNLPEAEKYYKQAIYLSKSSGAQLNNFGAFLCRQGKYVIANQYFEQASADLHYLNSAGSLENAGLCSLAKPDLELAQKYFKRAFEQDPKRIKSMYELAKIALDKKQYLQALEWVEQYQAVNPLEASVLLLAYQAATKAGLKEKADNFAWVLKNRFSQSIEYKQLIASSDNEKRTSNFS